MRKSKEELIHTVQNAVNERQTISLKTYILSDYGEMALDVIIKQILTKFDRIDLMEVTYTAAKELIINATKANIKKIIFEENQYDWKDIRQYEKGLTEFRNQLSEKTIIGYEKKFRRKDLHVMATFYYSEDVLNIKIKNNYPLFPIEERRIREKFKKAQNFSNLIEFYMEHGDNSEGAGLGLTMVSILLEQSEIDRHSFILYSSEKYNETIAKIEIPLNPNYITKREMFDKIIQEKNISADELRKYFDYNYKEFLTMKKIQAY